MPAISSIFTALFSLSAKNRVPVIPGRQVSSSRLKSDTLTLVRFGNANVNESDEPIKLTKREMELFRLLIEGKSSKEIADMLYISEKTVDLHTANIYDKLQVTNRVQAFRRAVRLGLLPSDDIAEEN